MYILYQNHEKPQRMGYYRQNSIIFKLIVKSYSLFNFFAMTSYFYKKNFILNEQIHNIALSSTFLNTVILKINT